MGVTTKHSYYQKGNLKRLSELGVHAPGSYKSFFTFNDEALAEGRLSTKLKELIAVAVAHVTGCAYCIDLHVSAVKEAGATKEEVSEAIFVATALKAGSAIAHGINALNSYDEIDDEEYYKQAYLKRLSEFSTISEDAFNSFIEFDQAALKSGVIPAREKELIAVAVAHVTGCPYCIDLHVKAAKKAGVTKEELAEAIFVAVALKAGSALAHSVNAFAAFDDGE
mgnify:FL=1